MSDRMTEINARIFHGVPTSDDARWLQARVRELEAANARMQKALDAAMQYVGTRDRAWIEALAAAGGAEGDTDA